MSFIKSLTLSSIEGEGINPLQKIKSNLLINLNEQLLLIENPSHSRSIGKWVKVDGTKQFRNFTIPVRPWWRIMLDGRVLLALRVGLKRVELEKGKDAIALKSKEQLAPTINKLILAVQNGELDALLKPKSTLSLPVKSKVTSKS